MSREKEKAKEKSSGKNKEFLVIMYLFFFLFLALIAYFVYFQVYKSEAFINSPYNSLQDLFSEHVIRGDIISSDGQVLATTSVSEDGTQVRSYPCGREFAHAVGYAVNGKAGLENQENFSLLRSHEFILKRIGDEFAGKKSQGDTVVTTLDAELQKTAYDALGGYDGAVIVMEPGSGKILAMVSKPDFDPNTVKQDWDQLTSGDSTVLYNRATQGKYAPGSVFKMFTVLEYYREHPRKYRTYSYDCSGEITVDGQTIHCAGNRRHGQEDLKASFANSCNSSFAKLSLSLDRSRFQKTCDGLLFNKKLPIAFESSVSSFSLSESDSKAMAMETGIGQGKTTVSPLHMLLMVSAVDKNGVLMTPYLVDHVENADGSRVSSTKTREYGTLLSEKEANLLKVYMRSVVTEGTGSALNGQSYKAYGKTGTAQVSDSTDQTNAWFTGFASREGYEDLAVAVIVEDSGAGSTYAVPIAKKIFDVYFNR
ncbi:MAG: peptidoglycan D,D-transpeptidase FtsI family protein [Agathobacter sp.]